MDLDEFRLFIDVARQGSFATVARDRGLDPSSVSRRLAALEARLGLRLIQRTTRNMVLTEAGEIFLAQLPDLLNGFERLREDASSSQASPSGVLRLTGSVAFGEKCLVPVLPSFRAAFPRLKLELILTDANLDLITERIDIAIRLGPSFRADVVGVKLFATRYHVVASPAYLQRHGQPRSPAELSAHACLLFALPEFRSRWLFRDGSDVTAVPVQGALVCSSPLALHRAAIEGGGPALLADWMMAADLASGALVDLFPRFHVTATSFDTAAWLLYPSRDHLPRKTRSAIDFLRSALKPAP